MDFRPTLIIADDHLLIADLCKRLLEPEYRVVAIVSNGIALVEEAARLKPDVVIVDVGMPQLNGFDAAEAIKKVNWRTKIVFLTMYADTAQVVEAFRRGASGYVVKTSAFKDLAMAVQKAIRGERYMSGPIDQEAVDYDLRKDIVPRCGKEGITARQEGVLRLLVQGMTLKQAAAALGVKMGTVAFHKYRMMESLGLRSNAELYKYAAKHLFFPEPPAA